MLHLPFLPAVAPSVLALDRFETLAEGLDHPEGVAYGPDGNLYAGGEAGQVYRISPAGRVEQVATTGGFILGLALDAAANIYACDRGRGQVVRVSPAGEVTVLSTGTADTPMRTPNAVVFDTTGRLYVSDSGDWRKDDGVLFRIDPDGVTRLASRVPCHFPNGVALSADGRWLYVVESTLPGVTRLPVGDDGSLGVAETVIRMPGTVPDGLAFDVAGDLYITCYRPDRIYRLSARGRLDVLADDPAGTVLAAPTNLAFAGPDLKQLVVASLGRWHLARAEMEVAGQPLFHPDRPGGD